MKKYKIILLGVLSVSFGSASVYGAPLNYSFYGLNIQKSATAGAINFDKTSGWKHTRVSESANKFSTTTQDDMKVNVHVETLPDGYYVFSEKTATDKADFFTITNGKDYYRTCAKETGSRAKKNASSCRMVSPQLCNTIQSKLGTLTKEEFNKCQDMLTGIYSARNELLKGWDQTSKIKMSEIFPDSKNLEAEKETLNIFLMAADCMRMRNMIGEVNTDVIPKHLEGSTGIR